MIQPRIQKSRTIYKRTHNSMENKLNKNCTKKQWKIFMEFIILSQEDQKSAKIIETF